MSLETFDTNLAYRQVWETVCDRVRASILSGELPAGTKLVEADLARTFGVSRGPIREALRELSREGLVVDLPRRGTFVCTLSQTDLTEVYAVREAIEAVAVREVVAKATDAEIGELVEAYRATEEAWSGTDWNVAITCDARFHLTLVKLAKNRRMQTIIEQMGAQTVLLLLTASESDVSLRGAPLTAIHAAIVDAVVARDAEAAQEAIAAHYRYTRERLFQTINGSANDEVDAPIDD
jgi:DNA-binding GntR family transcriptional regulator